ncbi:hypothetical protein QN345_00550 [Cryobacterium sp. 10I1]|uniref:hypothetical protein n=1 Tax=Cryobacterium sp. 10I1 TaxID=3048578 RepID=UPI002B23B148|nr:hypothetical protein [Cryobacterium sp. 10I1]MEB0303829.1 hypothetical protein [Cryobacterium sp. 10I1]
MNRYNHVSKNSYGTQSLAPQISRKLWFFYPDRLDRVRSIISVLLDIGRLLDRGISTMRDFGFVVPHLA